MLEKDEGLNIYVWVILNIMISWSIGLFIHAYAVFKGKILFSKACEDKMIEEYTEEETEEVEIWE